DQQAFEWLNQEGIPQDKQLVKWQADMRYPSQVFELTVDLDRELLGPPNLDDPYESFHAQHEQLYTFCVRDSDVEIVNLRGSAIGLLSDTDWALQDGLAPASSTPQPIPLRPVYFKSIGNFLDCPIYDRLALSPGVELPGPAVVVQMDTTTIVLPGQHM